MRYLLDTDIIINNLRNKKRLGSEILDHELAISLITLGELIYGSYKSSNPQRSLGLTEDFLRELGVAIIPLNEDVVYSFGQLKSSLEKEGRRLEDFDLLIAATAKVNNLVLVTYNRKHFERIPDLEIIS